MNLPLSKSKAIETFAAVDTDQSGTLDFEEFKIAMTKLQHTVRWAVIPPFGCGPL